MRPTQTHQTKYKRIVAIALLAASAASISAFAAGTIYYRWVDETGDTIHSDRQPPTGTKYEVVNAGEGFSYALPKNEETQSEAAAKPITAHSRKDPVSCQQAKDNMATLQGQDKVAVRDENGEVQILSAIEIKAQVEMTRGHIEIFCE